MPPLYGSILRASTRVDSRRGMVPCQAQSNPREDNGAGPPPWPQDAVFTHVRLRVKPGGGEAPGRPWNQWIGARVYFLRHSWCVFTFRCLIFYLPNN